MTLKSRLQFFIISITLISIIVVSVLIIHNAGNHLEKQNKAALKSSLNSFEFFYRDYIMKFRDLLKYTAQNSDIVDSVSDLHSIMAFVTERAAEEQMDLLKQENQEIVAIYIEESGSYSLGDKLEETIEKTWGKLKEPINDNGFLVAYIDLQYLVKSRLTSIKINSDTEFFIYDPQTASVILHTEAKTQDLHSNELIRGFSQYSYNGVERVIYTQEVDDKLFGVSIPYSYLTVNRKSLINMTIILLLSFTVSITFIGLFASNYITKPVNQMITSVKNISEKKYNTRIDITGDDELSIVGIAINEMADEIKNHTENLEDLINERTRELQETMDELKKISITDTLTGLYNRKFLDEALQRELARTRRTEDFFSVIFFDLDNFKSVNDTYGHKQGDRVLVGTSNIIRSSIRETDIAARWGGEEFIIVCPKTDIEGVMILAEKIRAKLKVSTYPQMGSVTGSFGCSLCTIDDTPTSLIHRCDVALYKSKEMGKNRITIG